MLPPVRAGLPHVRRTIGAVASYSSWEQSVLNAKKNTDERGINITRQRRLANMGHKVIRDSVPNMLTRSLPHDIIGKDITLNILPDSHPHVPAVVGRVPYVGMVKLLQLSVTSLLVPPDAKLSILRARLDPVRAPRRYSYYHENHVVPPLSDEEGLPPRFVVHWRTCSPETEPQAAASQNFYPHSWSSSLASLDPKELARRLGILPHEYPVLTGFFEFEFDESCNNVVIHTITDVEYLTKPSAEPSSLGSC